MTGTWKESSSPETAATCWRAATSRGTRTCCCSTAGEAHARPGGARGHRRRLRVLARLGEARFHAHRARAQPRRVGPGSPRRRAPAAHPLLDGRNTAAEFRGRAWCATRASTGGRYRPSSTSRRPGSRLPVDRERARRAGEPVAAGLRPRDAVPPGARLRRLLPQRARLHRLRQGVHPPRRRRAAGWTP